MIPVFTFCFELPFSKPADSIYRVLKTPYSFLLQSPVFHAPTARFSFAGFSPFLIFASRGAHAEFHFINNGAAKIKRITTKNPLLDLKNVFHGLKPHGEHDFPFTLGGGGFLSYEFARFFEKLPEPRKSAFPIPDLFFMFCRTVIVFSYEKNKTYLLISVPWYNSKTQAKNFAHKEFHKILFLLESHASTEIPEQNKKHHEKTYAVSADRQAELSSSMSKTQYMRAATKIKKYIAAGDIYQANIAQQFSSDFYGDAFSFYENLMDINPSPFSAFVDAGNFHIASCSPERLLKVEGRAVETRPIAGTRPRGAHRKEDKAFAKELLLNEKEKAEHLMLVDLERNDIGKVCGYHSVHVNEFMVREDYSHVFHIVSNVRGILQKNKDSFDAIQACFPGGTITGCPKIRSMEIIHDAENFRRGIYTGSIGYINYNGDMDLNIAIRTAVITNNKIYFSGGAGIVADSDPEREYYETLYKVEALVRALEKSQNIRIGNFETKKFKPERST